jgi:hypothetical protein
MAADVVTYGVLGAVLVVFLVLCIVFSCVYSMCCRVGNCFMWFVRNLVWIAPLLIVLGGMFYVLAILDPNDIRDLHGSGGPHRNGTANSTSPSQEDEDDLGEFYDDLALVVEKAQEIAGDAYAECKKAASSAGAYVQKWLLRAALSYVKSSSASVKDGDGACSSDDPSACPSSPTPRHGRDE